MLETALRLEHPGARSLSWIVEDSIFRAPISGAFMKRTGGLPASQANADQILSEQGLLAVFPEGVAASGKLYRHRRTLEPFAPGGFVELALRTRSPVLPVAVIGAEEAYPVFRRATGQSQLLGLPFRPLTPLFPWLGPLGMIPLRSSWRIVVGEPAKGLDAHPPEAADDAALVAELSQHLRLTLQNWVDLAAVS